MENINTSNTQTSSVGLNTVTVRTYHENGNLKSVSSYKDGDRDGVWEQIHEDGELWEIEMYKDGIEVGVWESYKWGLLNKREYDYVNNDYIWETYYENGHLRERSSIKNWKPITYEYFSEEYYHKEIVSDLYYENGRLYRTETHKDGKLINYIEYKEEYYNSDNPIEESVLELNN